MTTGTTTKMVLVISWRVNKSPKWIRSLFLSLYPKEAVVLPVPVRRVSCPDIVPSLAGTLPHMKFWIIFAKRRWSSSSVTSSYPLSFSIIPLLLKPNSPSSKRVKFIDNGSRGRRPTQTRSEVTYYYAQTYPMITLDSNPSFLHMFTLFNY